MRILVVLYIYVDCTSRHRRAIKARIFPDSTIYISKIQLTQIEKEFTKINAFLIFLLGMARKAKTTKSRGVSVTVFHVRWR